MYLYHHVEPQKCLRFVHRVGVHYFSINTNCFPIYSIYCLVFLMQGVLTFLLVMDHFEGLVKPTDILKKKNVNA
jgi:hypothetical protein